MTKLPSKHSAGATASKLFHIQDLEVTKVGQTICHVRELTLDQGERIGITGSNGSGKTTLLRVLGGFEKELTGQYRTNLKPSESVFVHQAPVLFKGTVLQNVIYGLKAQSIPRSQRRDIGIECLDQFGMADFADRSVDVLSGGERRRVALARAVILKPKLLLLDEPLADLDESGIQRIAQLLTNLTDSTILITSPTPLPADLVNRTIQLE